MSSVSGIRLPGLATGMDTETMVKEMLTGEQNKIDKVKQKEQTIKWQQEIYREIIGDVKELNDKYFSITSKDSIINSSAWNTLSVKSSNESVMSATGTAGASKVEYSFDVQKIAESAKATTSKATNGKTIAKNSELSGLGLQSDTTFIIRYGEGKDQISKPITILAKPIIEKVQVDKTDENGNPIKDADGNVVQEEKEIVKQPADTIDTLIKKINDATGGEVKASFSEMTGSFFIESNNTGKNSGFKIVGEDGSTESNALAFLNLKGKDKDGNETANGFVGSNALVEVTQKNVSEKIILDKETNVFTIDGVKYEVHTTGESEITSKQDVNPVVENMKAFVEDYNKIMDKIYDLVTQKANRDYQPLTEAQKEEMSEDEIEKWEKKAKVGILRNDSEMRKFMDDMQQAIFGNKMEILNEMGLTSHSDYNKKGQVALNEEKFIKALENNSEKVYETFAKGNTSVLERMKSTINKYVGGSSSTFAKKAGLEKTASAVKNFYSEQLKKQEEAIKILQRKMNDKENALYKKFGALEASMNKLNSQMSYFMQA